jgi:2-phospho-L-lactate guanylyltransferase (CobY/MobA/RfbA family)
MTILLIPVAPLSRAKSRLENYFSREQLKEFTIAMFKDLSNTLLSVDCFEKKIVYCASDEILELASDYNLIGVKEEVNDIGKPFDAVISQLNDIAMTRFNANGTVIAFLDLILITAENFYEINDLMKNNNMVVCPAIFSAGISILGRDPADIIDPCFSDPVVPSLSLLLTNARESGIEEIAIYDSFRAGFDIDIQADLLLAFEYLKIFNLTHTNTYKFLRQNLKSSLRKKDATNNRLFKSMKR